MRERGKHNVTPQNAVRTQTFSDIRYLEMWLRAVNILVVGLSSRPTSVRMCPFSILFSGGIRFTQFEFRGALVSDH